MRLADEGSAVGSATFVGDSVSVIIAGGVSEDGLSLGTNELLGAAGSSSCSLSYPDGACVQL